MGVPHYESIFARVFDGSSAFNISKMVTRWGRTRASPSPWVQGVRRSAISSISVDVSATHYPHGAGFEASKRGKGAVPGPELAHRPDVSRTPLRKGAYGRHLATYGRSADSQ